MENRLKRLKEFEQLLSTYHVSGHGKQILSETNLVLMMAPSATGRNTIIQELVKSGEYYFVVSDTTRHPRINNGQLEQNGREYWFRREQKVLADLRAGNFLEAAVIHKQQVSGISIRELMKAREEAKIAIADIQINGVDAIIKAKPDVKAIFVLPPSFDEWMKRLDGRGELSPGEKLRRLDSAIIEFSAALEQSYYRFIINDTLEHAVRQINAIAHGKLDRKAETEGRDLAKKLREETKIWSARAIKA